MSNKAVVVIDLQNDITKNYREIIEAVNHEIDWAVAENMDIIYIKHNNLSAGTRTFKLDTQPLSVNFVQLEILFGKNDCCLFEASNLQIFAVVVHFCFSPFADKIKSAHLRIENGRQLCT